MVRPRRSFPLEALSIVCLALLASPHARAQAGGEEPPVASLHLDDATLPDPTRTPGDAVADSTVDDLCTEGADTGPASPSQALCDERFARVGLAPAYRFQYRCLFLVPTAIGGARTIKNVWLQPAAEAAFKAALDRAVRERVCRQEIPLDRAQRMVAGDWVVAYRALILPGDRLRPVRKTDDAPPARGGDPLPASPVESPDERASSGAGFVGGGAEDRDRRRQRRLYKADDTRGSGDRQTGIATARVEGRRGEGSRRLPQDPVRDQTVADGRASPIGTRAPGDGPTAIDADRRGNLLGGNLAQGRSDPVGSRPNPIDGRGDGRRQPLSSADRLVNADGRRDVAPRSVIPNVAPGANAARMPLRPLAPRRRRRLRWR